MEVDKDGIERDEPEKPLDAENADNADSTNTIDSSINTSGSVVIIDDQPQGMEVDKDGIERDEPEKPLDAENADNADSTNTIDSSINTSGSVVIIDDQPQDAALEIEDSDDHPENPLLPDTCIMLDTTGSNISQDAEKSSTEEIESSIDDAAVEKEDGDDHPKNPLLPDNCIMLDTTGSNLSQDTEKSSTEEIESSCDGSITEVKDNDLHPTKLITQDIICLNTTESSSSQEVELRTNETASEKEDRGIYLENPFLKDATPLNRITADEKSSTDETASEKEDRGIYPENPFLKDATPLNRITADEKSSTDGAVVLEGFSLDVEGDMGNVAEEETPAPYPIDEVPRYNNIISGVLSDIEYSMDTGKKINDPKPKKNCFNCLGDHNVPECPEPQDPQRIAMNKKKLMANRVNNMRYHEDCENKYGQYQPGKISEQLREALGLRYGELPLFIYRMRCMGYPPGWLKEAEVHQADMKLYDGTGQSVCHPDNEEGEVEPVLVKYNPDKLVSYPGFNIDTPRGYRDEWRELNFPPMQKDHRKSEFKRFMELNKAGSYKKRKLKDTSLRSNGSITKMSSSSAMDIDESELNVSTEIQFNPPLPEEPLPPLPPPEDSPASPDEKAVPVEEGELLEDDSQSSMGYLEAKRQALLDQLEESGSSSNDPKREGTQAPDKESTHKETLADEKPAREGSPVDKEPLSEGTPADKRCGSSSDYDTESSTKLNDDSENSSSSVITKGVKKQKVKHYRSQSKGFRLGVAIPESITPYKILPDAEYWTVDVSDHINFDNLPDALGTWEKMKGLVNKVRKQMVVLHAEDDE